MAPGSGLTFATSSFVSGLRLVSCADMVRAVMAIGGYRAVCERGSAVGVMIMETQRVSKT
jgi:hypothetical protein